MLNKNQIINIIVKALDNLLSNYNDYNYQNLLLIKQASHLINTKRQNNSIEYVSLFHKLENIKSKIFYFDKEYI